MSRLEQQIARVNQEAAVAAWTLIGIGLLGLLVIGIIALVNDNARKD